MCPDCSPPTFMPSCAHLFQHISVTHLGADQLQMLACQIAFKAEVRHHRRDNAITAQQTVAAHRCRQQCHNLVAVDHPTLFVDHDQPVGIAIQRNANIGHLPATTVSCNVAGWVDPIRSLIFLPLGLTPIAVTFAPNSQIAAGAT